MSRVLNEGTNTLHKQETGKAGLQTVCGVTYHTPRENMKQVGGDKQKSETETASKCGRCFEGGGGY